jgi:uncharacterized SAM-binding protein YcdF (DUF218 family)
MVWVEFALSKILWALIEPAHAATLALFAAVWLSGRGARPAHIRARRLVLAVALFFAATAMTPLADLFVEPLENRFAPPVVLPASPAGIILLGGAVSPPLSKARGGPALNAAAERLVAFADLARRYPAARLISSGGSGMLFNQQDLEDAPTARALAMMGLDPARVIFENRSRNTYENALFSRDLMGGAEDGGKSGWILVTSAMHMPRSVGLFHKLGIAVIPYPVDYRTRGGGEPWLRADLPANLEILTYGVREWIGIAASFAAGRLDSLFPGTE